MDKKDRIVLPKGSEYTVEITEVNNLGSGVGHVDGKVVFVRGAVTGDVVRIGIIKDTATYAVGRVLRIEKASDIRVREVFCHAPDACGGCVHRYVTYAHELECKRNYVQNAFRKVGLPDVAVAPVRNTGVTSGYRNKGQYPVKQGKNGMEAGFFASKTHNLVKADKCALQPAIFGEIVAFVCAFCDAHGIKAYDEMTGKGLLRHIYLRQSKNSAQIMLCLVLNGKNMPAERKFAAEVTAKFAQIVGVVLNFNEKNTNVVLGKEYRTLWGKNYIEDELCGLTFKISPGSFYQVNREGAELLYGLAREKAALSGSETLLDLYCGTGTIGLSMAKDAKELVGIEIVPEAVECARENAARNGVENATFICNDAGDAQVILSACGGKRPDVAVIDPPRKGSTEALVKCFAQLEIPRVVYVSCDPDTLARDCKWFRENGYEIGEVTPVDMFPRTGHVESVVCLARKA
ncbi:MAG: 23S rRNA (uracil(1939)-C(5))-methyltransferase RlmD [Clostridia bacterium]|nr:23S rRNA (uracil(1939)-C(5))-methyltransferase RlmD [Clostridia bacterium]